MQPINRPHASRSRRRFLHLALAGFTGALINACAGKPAAPSSAPGAAPTPVATGPQADPKAPTIASTTQIEVRLGFWDRSIRPVLEAFQREQPDIKVTFISEAYDTLHRRVRAALPGEDGAPDLCAVSIDWLGSFATDPSLHYLTDLNAAPFDAASLKADFIHSMWDLGIVDGRQFAIPWLVFPSGLIYRTDLFKAAGFDDTPEAVSQQLKSWDDLIDLGAALRTKKSQIALLPDASDIFWAAITQSGRGLIEKQKVLIEEKATRPAQLMARARNEAIDANIAQNATAFGDLKQGRIAALIGSSAIGSFLSSEMVKTAGNWRAIPLPEGPANDGAVFLMIPRQSRHKEQAWTLLRYLAASAQGQNGALKTNTGFPAYTLAWQDPFYDRPNEFFGGQRIMRLQADQASQLPTRLISPFDRDATDVLEVEVNQILLRGKDPIQAMRDAEQALLRKNDRLVG